MKYIIYKLLHYTGIFCVLTSLGGAIIYSGNGGEKDTNRYRKVIALTHGIGLFLVLLGGFGMTAVLKLGFPMWVWLKVAIWLFLGAALALAYRKSEKAGGVLLFVILASVAAAYLALTKPL